MNLSTSPTADDLSTPAYVIDEALLDLLIGRFRAALDAHWPNSIMSYSVKTNSLPWILAHMGSRGVWAEVVSDSEFRLAEAVGFSSDRIVYNGPVKSRDNLRRALREGSIVNLDSKREVRWAAELAEAEPALAIGVGLRINWDLEARCPDESTVAGHSSRFGFDPDNGELEQMMDLLTASGVRISGLHMHRNSRTQSVDVFRAAARVAREICESYGLDLDWIDIGGGFYGNETTEALFDEYISSIRDELDGTVDPVRTTLVIEPGGSLIAAPVEFHARVVDVKDIGAVRYVVTDCSRVEVDPLFRKRASYDVLIDASSTHRHPVQVVSGFTCMEDDRLVSLEDGPRLDEGDRIVFRRVGAYTMTFSSSFIEFPPAVYVRRSGEHFCVRRKWEVGDYLQGNIWETADQLREAAPEVDG